MEFDFNGIADTFSTDPVLMPRSIFVIEPHPAVRESILFLVGPAANLHVVGSAVTHEAAESPLAVSLPDIIVLGLTRPDTQPIQRVRSWCPDTCILTVASFQGGLTPHIARNAGADACVSRLHGAPALLPTLKRIAQQPLQSASPELDLS